MDPRYGLLAGGVPLPPRRPPGIGSEGADLPGPPPPDIGGLMRRWADEERQHMAQQAQRDAQRQQKGMVELGELKQDYPYGSGFPETSPAFPRPQGQASIGQINDAIGNTSRPTSSEMGYGFGLSQMPPEYLPDRPIPLGELQRRWGVPRLEDL